MTDKEFIQFDVETWEDDKRANIIEILGIPMVFIGWLTSIYLYLSIFVKYYADSFSLLQIILWWVWAVIIPIIAILTYSIENRYATRSRDNYKIIKCVRNHQTDKEKTFIDKFTTVISDYWKFSELWKKIPKYSTNLIDCENKIKETFIDMIKSFNTNDNKFIVEYFKTILKITFDKTINWENTKNILSLFNNEELIQIVDIMLSTNDSSFNTIYNKIIPSLIK
jgi:hypothetical protein